MLWWYYKIRIKCAIKKEVIIPILEFYPNILNLFWIYNCYQILHIFNWSIMSIFIWLRYTIWNYYTIKSSVKGIPSTRLYSKFCSNTCKHYSINACISKHAFKACIYEYTYCMFIYEYTCCMFIYYYSSCFGFIIKSTSSVVNCSNKRSSSCLPRV